LLDRFDIKKYVFLKDEGIYRNDTSCSLCDEYRFKFVQVKCFGCPLRLLGYKGCVRLMNDRGVDFDILEIGSHINFYKKDYEEAKRILARITKFLEEEVVWV